MASFPKTKYTEPKTGLGRVGKNRRDTKGREDTNSVPL